MVEMKVFAACLTTLVLGSSGVAFAGGDVTVTLTPRGEQVAAEIGTSAQALAQQLDDKIDDAYRTYDVDGFLRAFANAAAFSNRGIGVDYASNSSLILGIAANAAVSVENFKGDNGYPVGGASTNASIMLGYNLASFGLPRLTVFGNGGYLKSQVGKLNGGLFNAGIHGQWKLITPTTTGELLLKWGGLDVTGGIEITRWNVGLADAIGTDFTIDGTTADLNAHVVADGKFDLTSTSTVIPIELTTSLRIGYFLSLYGGAGVDTQTGKTKVDASIAGDITADNPMTNQTETIGRATVTMSGTGTPSVGRLRGLAGLQINAWKLKAFAQVNYMPTATASVATGIRLAF